MDYTLLQEKASLRHMRRLILLKITRILPFAVWTLLKDSLSASALESRDVTATR